MLTRKAIERCATDHEELIKYIKSRTFQDQVDILKHTTISNNNNNNKSNNNKETLEQQYVCQFTFTIHPNENLWINENIVVEVKVTAMYPADPPEVYFQNEFSARSLIHRSDTSSLTITDSETGKVSSKLLTRDGWNRSYDFCCVYHTVKRFFEITQAEILDGGVYQRYESMYNEKMNSNTAWKVKMASHELQGKRRTMEDKVSLIANILNYESSSVSFNNGNGEMFSPLRFAAVFDGHGGAGASEYFANELPQVVCTELCHGSSRAPRAMLASFSKCDKRFLGSKGKSDRGGSSGLFNGIGPDPSGSTCSCVLIDRIGRCIISNVGDSRTILCRAGGKALELTYDHKASSPDEIARIVDMGGFVANNRLMGQIAVARALGDRHFKSNGAASSLSCEPDVNICQLKDGDEFFLLACDGLFDVCTSQEAVDVCRKFLSSHNNDIVKVSKLMAEHAIENGSTDNVSVAIVLLEKTMSFRGQNEDDLSQIYDVNGTIQQNNKVNVYDKKSNSENEINNNNSPRPFVVDEDEYDYVSPNSSNNGNISPLMIGSEEWDGDDGYNNNYNDSNGNNNNNKNAFDEIDQLLNDTALMNTPEKSSAVNHNKTRVNLPSSSNNNINKNANNDKGGSDMNRKKKGTNKSLLGLDDDTLDFLMDSNNFEEELN